MGTGVNGLVGEGRVTGVGLSDGNVLPADVELVAIGSVPNTAWLAGSGLSLTNGVDCDSLCRAAPNLVAAGDTASWTHPELEARVRVEHRMNATEQGMAAARTIAAIDGLAAGGGSELALACTLRLGSLRARLRRAVAVAGPVQIAVHMASMVIVAQQRRAWTRSSSFTPLYPLK